MIAYAALTLAVVAIDPTPACVGDTVTFVGAEVDTGFAVVASLEISAIAGTAMCTATHDQAELVPSDVLERILDPAWRVMDLLDWCDKLPGMVLTP